jgi:hypothetical protein
MIDRKHALALLILLGQSGSALLAQVDDRVAYVPSQPISRTADDQNLGLTDGAAPGIVEFNLPAGTFQVDLINSKGKVKHSRSGSTMEQLDLGSLKPGTWTLRAHTNEGLRVKRFVVMQRGKIAWSVPTKVKAR